MRSSFQVGFMAAIPASSDHAHTSGGIDIGWYPPNISAINDLNVVINGEGVYGFVYNTSTTPADIPYSTYNWCNMPHVRAAEYVIPPPQYQLQYVEVVSSQQQFPKAILTMSADPQASQTNSIRR
jgi:hypothetical protein